MRTAAGQEDARAQEALGFMLIFGDRLYRGAIAQDVGEGLRWLRRAAESGRKPAAYYLAQHARQGARQEASTEVNSSVTTP
jgi:TPR repeat protein